MNSRFMLSVAAITLLGMVSSLDARGFDIGHNRRVNDLLSLDINVSREDRGNRDNLIVGDMIGGGEHHKGGRQTNQIPLDANASAVDVELRAFINQNRLNGQFGQRSRADINSEKSQLGMKLFFTKGLGGDKDAACVTCHHPVLGGGDNLSMSIGVGAVEADVLGEGRVHNPNATNYDDGYAPVPRNAPTTFNIALWRRAIFLDGRVERVRGGISTPDSGFGIADINVGRNLTEAQARFPLVSSEEMKGFTFEAGSSNDITRSHLASRLSDSTSADYIANSWQDEFTPVYGANSVNINNITDAIASYEDSQIFVNTPWKSYVEGNLTAISDEAKNGAKLFYASYQNGGVSCVSCHRGNFFTDERYHVMAIPQVGVGKGNGVTGDDDFGRFNVSARDKYAFRTPTLLNVEVTGPWGHDGAYTTLEGIVAHMANPESAVAGYDTSLLDSSVKTTNMTTNTANALAQLNVNKQTGISRHQNVTLSTSEVNDLVSFLKTLTDPCVKDRECIGKWIPDNTQTGPDNLRLNAVNSSSDLL